MSTGQSEEVFIFPLSFAQERLWFLYQLEPGNTSYNISRVLHIEGQLNIIVLERVIQEIQQRHEVLRTTFKVIDGVPVQVVNYTATLTLPVLDLQELSEEEQLRTVEHYANQEAQKPFKLSSDLLVRVRLLKLAEHSHVLLITVNHIIADVWSIGIFIQELSTLYKAFSQGETSPLPELPIQYADFAEWQREWLSGEVLEQQLQYWKQQLAGVPALLELPTDKPRPAVQTFRGSRETFQLSDDLSQKLKSLSQQTGTTLFMTLLAAFSVLLSRYSHQEDIVIGSPIANRNRQEIEPLIGFFVNTLVLRTNLEGNPSFRELLQRVQQMTLDAYAHQDLPFEHLVQILQPERSLSHHPLFQVMFVLQNVPVKTLELPGLTFTPIEQKRTVAKFDLTLTMQETESGLVGVWEYNSDLFVADTIRRMSGHFQTLLEAIVKSPQQNIQQLPILTAAERHQLLIEWNQTQADYPQDKCLHQLFEEQVECTPDAIAVVFEDSTLTYQELNTRANQLAHYLQKLGVKPEVLVGICVERSLKMVIGLLGILKAGGAYVPIDPSYPPQRQKFILEDTQMPLLLTQQHLASDIFAQKTQLICLDSDRQLIAQAQSENPISQINPINLAYVIYTSGSTGQPKGTLITHTGLVNYLHWCTQAYQVKEGSGTIVHSSLAFDLTITSLFSPLLVGCAVELLPEHQAIDALGNTLSQRNNLSLVKITPAHLELLNQQLSPHQAPNRTRTMVIGGENLTAQHIAFWRDFAPDTALVNEYGPTETVVGCCIYQVPAGQHHSGSIPIGQPIANTQLYILDQYGQPVPIGVAGELHIGGVGVARGYLNRPDLNAEKFILNPFSDQPGARLYKTGDLARYRADGIIEYLGRLDHQVKIRGFRIELGEIEAVLSQHPQIQEVVVLADEDVLNNKRLVAYLVAKEQPAPSNSEIRNFLKEKLPEYMIPSAFVLLEELPLTPNGKVDRRALPAPEGEVSQEQNLVLPRTPDEEVIANIFAVVLGLQKVGIYNNFFELGGHSLLATQVISRLRKAFQVEVPLRTLFIAPTVAQLAQALSELRQTSSGLVVPQIKPFSRNTETLPLSWAQERLWFLDQLEGQSSTYNIPAALEITGQLNVAVLEQALNQLIQRHEVLRTSFLMVDGYPVQAIAPTLTVKIPVVDLRELQNTQQAVEIQRQISESALHPFDLATAPLLRLTILKLGENSHLLLVTIHHIISDGWSMGILVKELSNLYLNLSSAISSPLPELPIQYADFTQWQRQYLSREIETQINYWKQHLAGAPALLELPTDRIRPHVATGRGNTISFELSTELTQQLTHLSRQAGATLFMTLQTAFVILLSRLSSQDDINIGIPIANRNRHEIEPLIGFFVNTLVLRTHIQGNPSFSQLLTQVRQVALAAYAHQDVPFEQVVEALQPERNLSYSPLFQVMFAWNNAPLEKLELPGLTLTPWSIASETAKFDLTLSMQETQDKIRGVWEYNSDLFDVNTIIRWGSHFQTLLEAIATNPEQPVRKLPLLTAQQQQQLLVEWNSTEKEYPNFQCIHHLFAAQVQRTPEAVAVEFENQQLTYRELDCRVNQLAHHLQALGVEPETLVGLCVERSLEMIVGLLGILKAGGAYVPLDPAYPQARIAYILNDAQVSVLLTTENLIAGLPDHQTQIVCLDRDWSIISEQSADEPVSQVKTNNLAYVIYTSGSTGQPKGVMIEHRSLVNFSQTAHAQYEFSVNTRILQFASISFDTAAEEIYPCLTSGGTLVLRSDEMLSSVSAFMQKCTEWNLTVLDLPTAYWHQITLELANANLKLPESLQVVIIGGESALPEAVQVWQKYVGTTLRLVNTYGPTEATIVTTLSELSTSISGNIAKYNGSIGYPLSNVQVYLLDQYLQPVPIGVPGELYIGGSGLARGYLHRPELTQERFITISIGDLAEQRLYKTGDLALYLPDGNIKFIGRIDNQVKIRGFRVELGEIEAVLTECPLVQEAVVTVWEEQPENKRLVAYIVPQQEISNTNVLRHFLKEKLPEYMIPSAFVFLEALPLTPNGKLDRRALPAPKAEISLKDDIVTPRTPREEIIANIFATVLNLPEVGRHNNFFELGGHSLLATKVISRLRESFKVEIPLRTLFESPTVAELDQAIAFIQANNSGLVIPPIQPIPRTQPLPLSWGQERLWFLDQLEGANAIYNMPSAIQITGKLNIKALEQALTEIIHRHEILRTTFPTVNGIPVQAIASPVPVTIPILDWTSLPQNLQSENIQLEITKAAQTPFDLANDSLIRLEALQLAEENHILLVTLHHIIFDAWSSDIFLQELITLYQACINQEPSHLIIPSIQYADFAHWQRQWLQGEVLATQLNYWKQQLSGALPVLQLPTDYHPQPSTQNYQGSQQSINISQEVTASLKALSGQAGATLFMTLLTAFKLLLSRHSGQEDIIVGVPVAGRNHLGTENLIGFFINSLPLRTDLSGNPSFEQLLRKVREITLDAYQNQDIPFEKLVEELRPERSLSRHPFFDVMFNMNNASSVALELPGLTFEPLQFAQPESKFLMTVFVQEVEAELKINLVYRQNLFSPERISNLLQQFAYLLQQIAAKPDSPIQSYSLVTPKSHPLLPDPSVILDQPHYEPVTTLFLQWAEQTPTQTAIRQNGKNWTYQELSQKSQNIAQVILSYGIQPRDVVAVYGTRSFGLIASIVGVFLSGAVLLLVDPNLPTARQKVMLEEAQAKYILNVSSESHPAQFTETNLGIIHIDAQTATTITPKTAHCLPTLTPEDHAYIFFTSGSTGTPKGVLGTHKGIAHFLQWQRQTFDIGVNDRVAQLTSLTFDAILRDVFLPLTSGATLCLPNSNSDLGADQILHWLEQEQITLLHTVPAVAQSWLTQVPREIKLHSLRWIFFSGEPLTQTLVCKWRENFPAAGQIINLYGATETTMVKCFYPVPSETLTAIMPGGWPLPQTQVLVLNSTQELCGIGEIGEIVIRTPFRTLGYINNIAEQQQRFVLNPFHNHPEDLLYYTGDKGRYRLDGAIEVLGRLDEQIKIRGIRIQPAEIEVVLNQHPAVAESVVVVMQLADNDQRLVAYIVSKPNQTFAQDAIKHFLKQQLPEYLVPSIFVVLDTLPKNANGKINRRALPVPSLELTARVSKTPPRNTTEEIILSIFAHVLKLRQLGIDDNFFELGGHSLLATQVVARLRAAFQIEIPLKTLFTAPTVAELAVVVAKLKQTDAQLVIPPIKPRSKDTEFLPLSWAQERLWFLDQFEGLSATYNMSAALNILGQFNIQAFEAAYRELVRRHEILRTSFQLVNGSPVQVISPTSTTEITVVDLPTLKAELHHLIKSETEKPFNLAQDSLLRIMIIKIEADHHVLSITMHHIISDDWSMGILIQELSTLYQAFATGVPSPLPELSLQYADFALWQRQWLQGEILEKQLQYWQQQLAGIPTLLNLPTDRPRPSVQTKNGNIKTFELDLDLTQKIKDLSQQSGATPFMTLLAAFAILLSRYSHQEDIVIGSPLATRTHQELEPLIGIFLNTLVLRVDLQNHPTFAELLLRVRQITLDAYAHQDVPFEQLVEALQPERSLSHHPLFQVMFVLHNAPQQTLEIPELTFAPLERQRTVAKFDLTLSMQEKESRLIGTWEYNSDLFDQDTIDRMSGHFHTLLQSIVTNPKLPVGQLSLLTQQQQHQLLVEWNNTNKEYPRYCLHQLFEKQAQLTPDAIAVVYEDKKLTYSELNSRANQLAHYLQKLGVKPESLVGICVERSLEMVIGLLGILKAGGAYVPLDPAYPQERLRYMLEDSQASVLITQQHLQALLPTLRNSLVCLDQDWQNISSFSPVNPDSTLTPSNVAYVIYTSGSTGKPKGVVIEHRNTVAFLTWAQNVFTPQQLAGVFASTSLCFDLSVFELFLPLSVGGKVIIGENALSLPDLPAAQEVTLINTVPSALTELVRINGIPSSVSTVNSCGEALPIQLVQNLYQQPTIKQVVNLYGPSEDTVYSTFDVCSHQQLVTIGRPITNTQVYILDHHLQPVPIGVAGEIYIGGAGLARGYFQRQELTAQKFIPHPFGNQLSNRLYRTGDLACYLPDGKIKFLGRIDHQVKIRGFRIELGEIEASLTKHPQIEEVVVMSQEVNVNDQQLVAYVVAKGDKSLTNTELRLFLREQLPDYMIPTHFVQLAVIPRTPNGKINRHALPKPENNFPQLAENYLPPRNRIELQLTQIWSEVLNITSVGIRDNFFDLGGHSLLAVALMARIQENFGQTLPLATLFQGATIEQQALLLNQQTDIHSWSPLVKIQPQGANSPLFLIHPGAGSVLNYLKLAEYLGTDRPIYGLEARGFESGQNPDASIPAMAAHYIQQIQTIQADGPYLLAGWCMGGAIAFEMARQLQAQGQETSYLALIEIYDFDTISQQIPVDETSLLVPLFNNYLSLSEDELQQVEAKLRTMEFEQQLAYVMEQAQKYNIELPAGFGAEQLGRLLKVRTAHAQATVNYLPQPDYLGKLTLIQADEGNSAHAANPTLGWEALANQIELHWVTGNHYSIFQDPHIKMLADTIQATLNARKFD
ncbi:MAG TPA: amino acid adenylation domain-containing protein [Nostocaceae cyanobacterium]|nr:amino acid adenylation domain-containing protein [Nostocaceae cyanobacterium]